MPRWGTYSIVARDPHSGELGVAVQSHWFAVGPIVPWVRAGVGAVATQSIAEPAYGPRALDSLAAGARARDALDELVADDELARFRQVAVVDAHGNAAAYTGEGCIAHAGHQEGHEFSAQANMMGSPEVWPAMAHAFEAATGSLARRLVAALHAAEARGGDARGRQSCALVVAPGAGRALAAHGRPARRRPPRAAGRARPPARPVRRLRAGHRGRRPRRPGPPRGGRGALPQRQRAGARQPRAALLGRPGRRAVGRPADRPRAGARGDPPAARLARAAGPAGRRDRPRGARPARGAGRVRQRVTSELVG